MRESNLTAQKLYQKYGFQIVGVRKGYYLDNQENALIMCSEDLKTEGFKMRQSGIANRQQTSTGL